MDHHQKGGGASPLQLVKVKRNDKKEIVEFQMTGTFREPPDVMLNFRKDDDGNWVFYIADFVDPSREHEKCERR